MELSKLEKNTQANESISKFKLLSAYGGPGSIVHTQYGSIIISCIEEWGFLKKILDIEQEGIELAKSGDDIKEYVISQAKLPRNGNVGISNDNRLLQKLIERKKFDAKNFKYLVLIPSIDIKDLNNEIIGDVSLTIPSSFMPKIFADKSKMYKYYHEWYNDWLKANHDIDPYGVKFFPPKKRWKDQGEREWIEKLTQDNIVLICDNGHISDFPWSQFLRWRNDKPMDIFNGPPVDLFNMQPCCGSIDKPTARILITSNRANSSGFDGKTLRCSNEGCGSKPISLQGLMSVKIKCPGHKPWEARMEGKFPYSGNTDSRKKNPPVEKCNSKTTMKVALTTGNNLYYSRIMSSIYIPNELFEDENTLILKTLEADLEIAKKNNDFQKCIEINDEVQKIKKLIDDSQIDETTDTEKEIQFRFQEFNAFTSKPVNEINIEENYLKVFDVTQNLSPELSSYFTRILRIDNMKITSAQLDFSRVAPADADASPEDLSTKNIFKSQPNQVQAYPVVENYGEGIFFSFNEVIIEEFKKNRRDFIENWRTKLRNIGTDSFSEKAVAYAQTYNWRLYLVHTFAHIIMRELEFRCGYPTASLSERIYVSHEEKNRMYGCLIYTAEGAEGSMGGLIAQTSQENLNNLIFCALKRATICDSDPLCWESDGQGLFDLNFASCFSCSLVSETSCELRNIYLDRKILVDDENGFFIKITKE